MRKPDYITAARYLTADLRLHGITTYTVDPGKLEAAFGSIQPGTRCGCGYNYNSVSSHVSQHAQGGPCLYDAVRMVTVRYAPTADEEARIMGAGGEVVYRAEVPMCAPCADFHEKHRD